MLKIGVVGGGHLGKIHLGLLASMPEIELVGFYDTNVALCKQLQESRNIRACDSIFDLLQASDALVIASPTITHAYYAELALQYGKHLFIEKPLTQTIEEANRLMQVANGRDEKIQVGFVERFNPAYLSVKDQITAPLFIESHRLAMFNSRGTDVSVVLDLMIHDLDILLDIVPSEVESVSACGVSILSDSADIANARISFQNGCVANLTASRFSMKSMRKMRIFQQDAYISLDFLERKSQVIKMTDQPIADLPHIEYEIERAQIKHKKFINVQEPSIAHTNAIEMELSYWIASIENNHATFVGLKDGFDALVLAHRIEQNIIENTTKTINNL